MEKLDFETAYHQFYIVDKGADDSDKSRLAIAEGIIGVSPGSYGHIRGELSLVDCPSNYL